MARLIGASVWGRRHISPRAAGHDIPAFVVAQRGWDTGGAGSGESWPHGWKCTAFFSKSFDLISGERSWVDDDKLGQEPDVD